MTKKLNAEEVWQRKQGFDFELLLEPYREGGTDFSPIRRTMGTIVDYLLYKKKYPIDIIGAAIFKVFLELQAGREFPGDGSYGSKGRELVTYIRMECDAFEHKQIISRGYEWTTQTLFKSATKWAEKETRRKIRPWFIRMFVRRPPIDITGLTSIGNNTDDNTRRS